MVGSSSPFLFSASIPMRFRFHSFSKLKFTIEKTTPSNNVLRIGSTYRFVFQRTTDFQSIFDARNIACVKNFKSYLYLVVYLIRIQLITAFDAKFHVLPASNNIKLYFMDLNSCDFTKMGFIETPEN